MGRPLSLFVIAALIVSACAPSGAPTTTTASSSDEHLRLLVIGDSIPYSDFCEGCNGFVDQYAANLETSTGRMVDVVNRSRNDSANLADIKRQVTGDASLRDQLGTADIVIVSVGYNDQVPWPADGPCHGGEADTLGAQIAAILLYTNECIDETIETYRSDYQSIFGEVSSLVREPRVLLALTVYNNALGYPGTEGAVSAGEMEQLATTTKRMTDKWNEMLCETGEANNFGCVDIYHAFNGPDGTTAPSAKLGTDYTHPSQIGNDVIAALLENVDVSAVTG